MWGYREHPGYKTNLEPRANPHIHTVEEYEVDAFHVTFERASDGEVTEFLSVLEIIGPEHVRLRVGPFFRMVPGGTVYLPAGRLEWGCHPPNRVGAPTFTMRAADYPGFHEYQWLKAQYDCACRIYRRNRLNELVACPKFAPPQLAVDQDTRTSG